MGTLTIHDLDDHVIDRLKIQARANQRSLEGEVRRMLADHVDRHSRMAELRERTKRLASATGATPQSDSVTLLRADRNR